MPTRELWCTTSLQRNSRSSTAAAPGAFRSRAKARLPRCPAANIGSMARCTSPAGGPRSSTSPPPTATGSGLTPTPPHARTGGEATPAPRERAAGQPPAPCGGGATARRGEVARLAGAVAHVLDERAVGALGGGPGRHVLCVGAGVGQLLGRAVVLPHQGGRGRVVLDPADDVR